MSKIARCDCGREQSLPDSEDRDGFLRSIGWAIEGETILCPFCNPDPEGMKKLRKIFERGTDA